ncbi:hypothetical protein [Ferviditalea candida]|uniref:Uncharacterized protein n=1 Tax=Ferviditalea candida TaxID=3108399 RepID=A0ABU5ZPX2_9BACL|nr:hypothetical protein [Paenibacillaceae bacterium T2]
MDDVLIAMRRINPAALVIVKAIVEAHGGTVEAGSGRGGREGQ